MENHFEPAKLTVTFGSGVTRTDPILERRYTLAHSDKTAEFFLTVSLQYAYDQIHPTNNDVFGEWRIVDHQYYLFMVLFVDGQSGGETAARRSRIFRQELPLALTALRYGDRAFFTAHPNLDLTPVWVHFASSLPEFNQHEYWGTPGDYRPGITVG